MIALFLLLVIVAMVLGIVGVVAKGLLYLLFIGIVVFLGALLLGALRMRRRPGRARLGTPSLDFGYCPVRGPPVASGLSRIRLSPVQKAEDAFYRRSRQPHRGL